MKKILIIDDDRAITKMLVRRLKKAGYDICTAENGVKGIKVAYEFSPDIILMDMHMPVMDGYHTTQALRKKGWQRPIIALTASVMAIDTSRAMKAGCDHFIPKPIDLEFEVKLKAILDAGYEQDSGR